MPTRENVPVNKPGCTGGNPKGKTYLFFIAIDQYKYGIKPLGNAVRDAEAVAECLLKYYELDQRNLRMLINEYATRRAIITQFDQYQDIITDEDNLIFYFSGHGCYYQNIQRGYWLTAESESQKRETFLSNDEVLGFIKNLKARHVFGIVDACFSAALFTDRNINILVRRSYNIPSRWLLTAGRLEPVSDGSLGDHSPFAKTLLAQLRYQDKPKLLVSQLCINVLHGIQHNTQNQLPRGRPLQGVGDQGGEMILFRKDTTSSKNNEQNIQNKHSSLVLSNTPELLTVNNPESKNVSTFNNLKKQLVDNLTEGEWKAVFDQLKKILIKERKNNLLLAIIRRYNALIDAKIMNTMSEKKINISINNVYTDLLTFIHNLEEKDLDSFK